MKTNAAALACALGALLLGGCRQDMHDQPKYKPLGASDFFRDGRQSRPRVPGTVARGELRLAGDLASGRVRKADGEQDGSASRGPTYVKNIPLPITPGLLHRGRERYDIFCAVCHDRAGTGEGMIVQRGYRRPPSYHTDRLREAADGYFFDVITNGFGVMPSYARQVSIEDRWAITAYIRALQLSQAATLADVPPARRAALERTR